MPTVNGVHSDGVNASEVTNGASEVTNGANEATNGANEVTNGANEVTNGANKVTNGANGVNGAGAHGSSEPYSVRREPYGTRRKMRIICMGTGFSGVYMSILHENVMKNNNVEYVCYEKNSDIGGTWFENRYPGCRCDKPSHEYSFTFEPKPDWKEYYAKAEDIHTYIKQVATKHGISKYTRLNHTVTGAKWDAQRHKWTVQIKPSEGEVFYDECDIFINAGGILKYGPCSSQSCVRSLLTIANGNGPISRVFKILKGK